MKFCASLSAVMPGLGPGIHFFRSADKTWMAGTSPGMTTNGSGKSYRHRLMIVCVVTGAILVHVGIAAAQQRPTRSEIWDLKLGTPVAQLPDDFADFACGTGGGPGDAPSFVEMARAVVAIGVTKRL
jgi:hypothetical protein